MSKKTGEALLILALTGVCLLIFSWFVDQRLGDPISDSVWIESVAFATSTPKPDLMTEGGWWDEMATPKPSMLPAMPEIKLLESTATPLSATQTVLALTPSITPTRTPLYDVKAIKTSSPTPTKDE